ncbi:MAG: NAD(P)H-binding protein [Candidatus Binataceae bacterium]
MRSKLAAVAGGSGFIGGAIVRRLVESGTRVRVLTRSPERAKMKFQGLDIESARADVTDPASLANALAGVDTLVNAVQFDGYPVENPRRGLTYERIDYGGTAALLKAAAGNAVRKFIYISGASTDEKSSHPAFRNKALAERAIRGSGLDYTIFRPSLVYGPDDRVLNALAQILRLSPVFVVPGTGRQRVQPLFIGDLSQCVALALGGRGRNQIFEIGGPDIMSFDAMITLMMDITGHRRLIVHAPEGIMRIAGALGELAPKPLFSRDAVKFVTADNICDNRALLKEFAITLTRPGIGMAYLAPKH